MDPTTHPIRCRCGRLRGTLTAPAQARRITCYCRDCQTYAHALGSAERVLDALGGTDVVATLQHRIKLQQGQDQLACLSLSPRGIYRWYARCCHTPIANTARNPQMSYVGLVHTALGDTREQVAAAWPVHFHVNPQGAKAPVPGPGLKAVIGTAGIMARVLGARVSGAWRRSPFFDTATLAPVVVAHVLTLEERDRARAQV